MNDAKMNAKIRQAFVHATPDVLDSVLSDCQEQKGTVIFMTETKKTKRWIKYIAGVAACLVLMLGGAFGFYTYNTNYTMASTVSLDVNPSIQIAVNQKERVLDVVVLNEDGRTVIGDMNFSGSDIDVTVNALIGSMLRNGYLSELANTILISVDNNDPVKSAALQERLTQEIDALLQTDSFTGAVLSQTIIHDSSLQQMADQYGITVGKAQLIQEILKGDARHTFEELAPLTINELNLIIESGTVPPEVVSSVGIASDKAYIGEEKAKDAALAHAGLSAAHITDYEMEMDSEQGVLVYEINFTSGGYEYEYDIDALTGEVVKHSKEKEDDHTVPKTASSTNTQPGNAQQENGSQSSSMITAEKAKELALRHAGLPVSSVTFIKAELDDDDGVAVYDVEFYSGNTEYDYEIDAASGKIRSVDKDIENYNTPAATGDGNMGNISSLLTAERAKELALRHAGLPASSVTFIKAELDDDDGVAVYDVEFYSGNMEYDYEVHAVSGDVLDYDCKMDDETF